MQKTYKLEQFEGPLDLLLQMTQKEEMDITTISLASVAEQFVGYIEKNTHGISGEELADFLVVATQLLLLKSQMLLPNIEIDDEMNPESLETQLKLYRRFVDAAAAVQTKIDSHQFLYSRVKSRFQPEPRFSPPAGFDMQMMAPTMEAVLKRLEPIVILPQSVMEKTVTMHEKIRDITSRLKRSKGLSFRSVLEQSRSKIEQIVSFLALLELVKQQEVIVKQKDPFEDILISRS